MIAKDRKSFLEMVNILLDLKLKDKEKTKELEQLGVNKKDINNRMSLVLTAFKKAESGDIKAIEFLRDSAGDKPDYKLINQIETDKHNRVVIINDLPPTIQEIENYIEEQRKENTDADKPKKP